MLLLFLVPGVRAESIDSYQSDIRLSTDARIHINETIHYDFGDLDRHGIFRTVPLSKKNTDGNEYRMSISNVTVDDGAGDAYTYTISGDKREQKIKIGDPDRTITGKHLYAIGYEVSGALTYFSDHDELYWNAIGTDWTVPIATAEATVTLPDEVNSKLVTAACYVGAYQSTDTSCVTDIRGSVVSVRPTRPLESGEGMSLVVGFPKGIVAVVEPVPMVSQGETWILLIVSAVVGIAAFCWYILMPILIVYWWFTTGRDPKSTVGVVSAWFDVPKTKTLRRLTPGETGTLTDEVADIRDITATIVDLARRGYVHIIEDKGGTWSLRKITQTNPDEKLEPFEKILMDGIFGKKELMKIKEASLTGTIPSVQKALYEAVVSEGYFAENPDWIRTKYTILGVIALVSGNIPLVLAAFLFGRAMPRKTLDGANAAAVSISLRNFIKSQDRQYRFQAEAQMLFEKFLPFAIVFGVEKIWGERFKDLSITNPDWYEGNTRTGFSPMMFTSSLSSSFHSSVQSSSISPTRSSTGHSSGFSGGFSGGGGGGGGGGSW
jgi:uncharacterized membrane protein